MYTTNCSSQGIPITPFYHIFSLGRLLLIIQSQYKLPPTTTGTAFPLEILKLSISLQKSWNAFIVLFPFIPHLPLLLDYLCKYLWVSSVCIHKRGYMLVFLIWRNDDDGPKESLLLEFFLLPLYCHCMYHQWVDDEYEEGQVEPK